MKLTERQRYDAYTDALFIVDDARMALPDRYFSDWATWCVLGRAMQHIRYQRAEDCPRVARKLVRAV